MKKAKLKGTVKGERIGREDIKKENEYEAKYNERKAEK